VTDSSDESRAFAGGARALDLPHAVTKAILAALNRRLAKLLGETVSSRP
jgi:hypothetical protein